MPKLGLADRAIFPTPISAILMRRLMPTNMHRRRLYKADDKWKSTDSFGRNDLHLLANLADLAETWIYEQNK